MVWSRLLLQRLDQLQTTVVIMAMRLLVHQLEYARPLDLGQIQNHCAKVIQKNWTNSIAMIVILL